MDAKRDYGLLTSTEVARILGVSGVWVRVGLESELCPLFTSGGHRRYRRADVERVKARRAAVAARVAEEMAKPESTSNTIALAISAMRDAKRRGRKHR